MIKVFCILLLLLSCVYATSSGSSSGICSQDGTSCVYPQGWDVCLTCTTNRDCNGQSCVTASLLPKQSGCYGIAKNACNCTANTANGPCAQGDGCCYKRLSYSKLRVLVGAVGWVGASSFYVGRFAESVLHIIVLVIGALAIVIVYSISIAPIVPEDSHDNKPRCTCCIYRPTCTPRFAVFWTLLSLYLTIFIIWWIVDVILYTEMPMFDSYNLELYD